MKRRVKHEEYSKHSGWKHRTQYRVIDDVLNRVCEEGKDAVFIDCNAGCGICTKPWDGDPAAMLGSPVLPVGALGPHRKIRMYLVENDQSNYASLVDLWYRDCPDLIRFRKTKCSAFSISMANNYDWMREQRSVIGSEAPALIMYDPWRVSEKEFDGIVDAAEFFYNSTVFIHVLITGNLRHQHDASGKRNPSLKDYVERLARLRTHVTVANGSVGHGDCRYRYVLATNDQRVRDTAMRIDESCMGSGNRFIPFDASMGPWLHGLKNKERKEGR